jgi:hypothetical protein
MLIGGYVKAAAGVNAITVDGMVFNRARYANYDVTAEQLLLLLADTRLYIGIWDKSIAAYRQIK